MCVGEPKRVKDKCEVVAETSTDTVKTSVNNMQLIIDNIADGSKCPAVGEDQVKKAKKEYDEAVARQKKDQRKCQCTVREDYNAAWTTATTHNMNNLNAWNKAQHLICVHKGDLKIDSAGVTSGTCNVPACPQVKGKKLHISVSVLKATDCVKGTHFEEAMSEVEDLPDGYHTMPDGSVMADE